MGQLSVTLITSLILFFTYYLLVFSVMVKASAISSAPSSSSSATEDMPNNVQLDNNNRRMFKQLAYGLNFNRNIRTPFSNSLSQQRAVQLARSKIPIEMDFLMDDDDLYDKSKRYDDYGHMRFGKRNGDDQFDDYGHMRFGKRGE